MRYKAVTERGGENGRGDENDGTRRRTISSDVARIQRYTNVGGFLALSIFRLCDNVTSFSLLSSSLALVNIVRCSISKRVIQTNTVTPNNRIVNVHARFGEHVDEESLSVTQ